MRATLFVLLILSSLFFSFNEKTLAQAPGWQWASGLDGGYEHRGFSIAADHSGNAYTNWYYI